MRGRPEGTNTTRSKMILLASRFGNPEMSVMDRIKRSAEQPDSSSVPYLPGSVNHVFSAGEARAPIVPRA